MTMPCKYMKHQQLKLLHNGDAIRSIRIRNCLFKWENDKKTANDLVKKKFFFSTLR